MNLDRSRKYLTAEECFFLLNNERYLNSDGSKKGTLGETGPLTANSPACDMQFPAGENYIIGKYYSKLTNELYYWNWNSHAIHFISRINGEGECEIVYTGDCLKLSADPRHSIEQFRADMQVDKICANKHGKYLMWTDGLNPIGFIDTEASIATNFFTTEYFQRCAEGCEFIELCVPNPCDCLHGEFVPLDPGDRGLKNNLIDVGVKLAYKHYYYDGRESEWSDPSTLFYQDTKGCFDNTDGFPRCLKLRVPVGNPLVEKIGIAFWKDGVWYLSDIIEKYKKYNSTQQYWYERELAELTNYSDEDCAFDYFFCNDKQCDTIDPKEFTRVFNPYPIKPQGILPIGIGQDRTARGLYNYEQGSCPVDKTEIEKVSVGISCPDDDCNPEYATVKVRLIIHNRGIQRNQFIYKLTPGSEDDPADTAYFGGLNGVLSGGFEIPGPYDQFFNEKTRNFIVYVEGTDLWAEMKQWKSSAFFQNRQLWGIVPDMDEVSTRNRWRRAARNGEFFYQEAEIKVLKGTRGFLRVASHHSVDGLSGAQDTSTFIYGIQDLAVYKGDLGTEEGLTKGVEELYFDTCDGDVEIGTAFVVDDNAVDDNGVKASAYQGYIKDLNGRPVEGAVVEINGIESVTDHNGFYHTFLLPGVNDPVDIHVNVEQDCYTFSTITTSSVQGAAGENTSLDILIDNETYRDGFYANVQISVLDCDGQPVGGVRVALSGTKYDVTDAAGIARFRIRNYETRNRTLRAIVLNSNGCFATDCAGLCNPCMPTSTSSTIPCYFTKPTITLTTAVINRDSSFLAKNGLKAGGRYPFAFVVDWGCGQMSAANEIGYLDIPRTQEKNKEGFCSFTFNGTGLSLPGAKCIKIVRGVNVNPFELQWVVDKIERNDGKIKLTIQSLNDYNEKYFFKTNTIYQWLKNDRVEFIKNGDGTIFTIAANGLLNYLTLSPFFDKEITDQENPPADYFNQLLIDDDGKLDGLLEGAVIELQRSKECTTVPVYHSICVSIPVKEDGSLLYETGTFTTFDTFYVRRSIGEFPGQQFEHRFPSDFWGSYGDGSTGLSDAGRAYFVNKFENKRRYGRNITINAPNIFNYFGDLVKTINPDNHGDIIAMWITDNKIGLCISEHDNSLFEVGDDLLRVSNDGIVRAVGPDAVISDSQPKISGTYGCQYPHIGSILFGDGWATWVDVNKHTFVKHDYQLAKPADEGKMQTHFRKRCQELESWNKTHTDPLDQYRFATGQNLHTGAVHITIKALRHSGVYNEIKPFLKPNDTIMYHPIADDCLGYASFTPEGYGQLNLFDGSGCAFISFLNGIPYIHPIVPEKWNEFYGIACDRVVGISMNKYPEKIKKGIAVEIQDETMWYVADVQTDLPTFKSEIPAIRMKRDRNKWNGAFLRDLNSRGGLYNGKEASGYYHAVTFIRDNTNNLEYGTIDNTKRVKFDSLDEILMKFEMVGQSGFVENL